MRRTDKICIVTSLAVVLLCAVLFFTVLKKDSSDRIVKVGFVYSGDESEPYAHNFIMSQHAVEAEFGDRVEVSVRSNIPDAEEDSEKAIRSLAEEGCDVIFITLGYAESAKRLAAEFPDIQFCQQAGGNSEQADTTRNYHTFMGRIYEGRYVSGVAAGMKLREMIDARVITAEQARVGYVAAYPSGDVISGYTAFILGIRSVVPKAVMTVTYTNTWSSYTLEKEAAERMIADGCVLISQHTDTIGPAVACQNAAGDLPVYNVGYNQSMVDVAPTTSLVSTRINWTPYIIGAVEAVLEGKRIESHVKGSVHGNDIGAGFDRGWVEVIELNSIIAAKGTQEKIGEVIEELKKGKAEVFKGDYIGVDPTDPADTIDLSSGYKENDRSSAPSFHYVLKDVVQIAE